MRETPSSSKADPAWWPWTRFFVGNLKGVGKISLQSVTDRLSRHAWGRLYTSKLPLTVVQGLNNDVLPFFEEYGIRVKTVRSDVSSATGGIGTLTSSFCSSKRSRTGPTR